MQSHENRAQTDDYSKACSKPFKRVFGMEYWCVSIFSLFLDKKQIFDEIFDKSYVAIIEE